MAASKWVKRENKFFQWISRCQIDKNNYFFKNFYHESSSLNTFRAIALAILKTICFIMFVPNTYLLKAKRFTLPKPLLNNIL